MSTTDGFVLTPRFAPSRTPYAVDPATFRIGEETYGPSGARRIEVDAVWAGRKHGNTTVSVGHLWDTSTATSLNDFLDQWDGRYGGRPRARWDGHTLWTEADFSEDERARVISRCRDLLAAFPAIPTGHIGWLVRRT